VAKYDAGGEEMNEPNAQERASNLIDEWHETTRAASGDCIGYSTEEWTQLETLITAAIREAERQVWCEVEIFMRAQKTKQVDNFTQNST
jgi:hypothetical protein